ncbi:triokinase/FMN cyclase-like [Diadema antillarum]|uniref:triokinase/FMN cyclase-like n=1 Tax=Diadema antillarum TaxID=105358 RepID=UPI003A888B31
MASLPTKKLINKVDSCVDEALDGLVAVTPGVLKLAVHRVIIRDDIQAVKESGKVTLLSGGGSGHEPAHVGFVGRGMLSGAVAGSVFASPPISAILAAIQAVGRGSKAGTLLVVTNYTGDCINFGVAMERAQAEGLLVDMVVVGDDSALSDQNLSDRRGLSGTIFMYKLAGAMAENGKSLPEIKTAVEAACASLGTVGLCLYPCSVPGAGPSFTLGPDEIGLGLGIHGEAGVKTLQMSNAHTVVTTMLDHMRAASNNCRLDVQKGDEVALMVNNLGGTSNIEMCIVAREALSYLDQQGVRVQRLFCGTFMTSLEMAGVSLTILRLDQDGHRVSCLDQMTTARGWPRASRQGGISLGLELQLPDDPSTDTNLNSGSDEKTTIDKDTFKQLQTILVAVCDRLVENEQLLNDLDTSSGDGDCGSTMRRGAQEMKLWLEKGGEPRLVSDLAGQMSRIAEQAMGGSSGAFYGLFLLAAQRALVGDPGFAEWVSALKQGMDSIKKHGKADVGDRTMLDPLDAVYRTLSKGVSENRNPVDCFSDAVIAADQATDATAKMAARAGRARYVNPDQLGRPDPGATAVSIWLRAALQAMQNTT